MRKNIKKINILIEIIIFMLLLSGSLIYAGTPQVVSVNIAPANPGWGQQFILTLQMCLDEYNTNELLVAVSTSSTFQPANTGGQIFLVSKDGINIPDTNPNNASGGNDFGYVLAAPPSYGNCNDCGGSGNQAGLATESYNLTMPSAQQMGTACGATTLNLLIGGDSSYFGSSNWAALTNGACSSSGSGTVLSWSLPTPPANSVTLDKRVEGVLQSVGDLVLFSIDYTYGNGPLTITDSLPGGGSLALVSVGPSSITSGSVTTPGVGATSGTVTWTFPNSTYTKTGTVWILMRMTTAMASGTSVPNTANATSGSTNDSASATLIVGQAAISVQKLESVSTFMKATNATVTITYYLDYQVNGDKLQALRAFDDTTTGTYGITNKPPAGWKMLPYNTDYGTWTISDPCSTGDRILTGAGQSSSYPAMLLDDPTPSNVQICTGIVEADVYINPGTYPGADGLVILRSNGQAGGNAEAYSLLLSIDTAPAGAYMAIQKCAGSSCTYNGASSAITIVGNTWYRTKTYMTQNGNDYIFNAKVWQVGQPEPTGYQVSFTDTGAATTGFNCGAGATYTDWRPGVGNQSGDGNGTVQDAYNNFAILVPRVAANATLYDTIPTGLTYAGSNPGAATTNPMVSWNMGNISDQSGSYTWWASTNACAQSFTNVGGIGATNIVSEFSNPVVFNIVCMSPTFTITPTRTPTPTPNSNSPTFTYTRTYTLTNTPTVTFTRTSTVTYTNTNTVTYTYTYTDTVTATRTVTFSVTNTVSITFTKTYTPTYTQTPTPTATMTYTNTASPTPTYTQTVTYTFTYTATSTSTRTETLTITPTYTQTSTRTNTPTYTNTMSPTDTYTDTVTYTSTQTPTPTNTHTPTYTITTSFTVVILSATFTPTYTITKTITPTYTQTDTNTNTPTYTNTTSPTDTYTETVTYTSTETPTPTSTHTPTYTITMTYTIIILSATFTPTYTITLTETFTYTATSTYTDTSTATSTNTVTDTQTETCTYTNTSLNTPSFTPTSSDTPTCTYTYTITFTPTSTSTYTSTSTQTLTDTASVTYTGTLTQTSTYTYTSTSTQTLTDTATATITQTLTITITPQPFQYVINISVYNEAGELVKTITNTTASGEAQQVELLLNGNQTGVVSPGSGTAVTIRIPGIQTPDQQKGTYSDFTWDGTNSAGQNVVNGVYYIKETTTDPYGHTNVITKQITAIGTNHYVQVNIFNSAGELVQTITAPYNGNGQVSLDVSNTNGNKNYVLPVGKGAPPITISYTSTAAPLSWDGKNSQGNYVQNGVYEVQLVVKTGQGSTVITSKSITILNEGNTDVLGTVKSLPNPYSGDTTTPLIFTWQPSAGGTIKIKIYNIAGELVRTLAGDLGAASINWDLKGVGGEKVSSGTYICVVEGVDNIGNKTRKIVKISALIRAETD